MKNIHCIIKNQMSNKLLDYIVQVVLELLFLPCHPKRCWQLATGSLSRTSFRMLCPDVSLSYRFWKNL